jgi:CBS domain containing-hemolysin-like protein
VTAVPALLISFVLLLLNGFFVASEFALLASRRGRLNQLVEAGSKRAAKASRSLGELTVMLAGAQLGITLCSFGLGALAEPAIADGLAAALHERIQVPTGAAHAAAFIVALTIVVFLHMVVGEMAPKSWAIAHPEKSAMMLITPFRAFTRAVRPMLIGLNGFANAIIRVFGIAPKSEVSMALSGLELSVLLQRSKEHGSLDMSTHALLTRSLSLSQTTAKDAATPRDRIVAVDVAADEQAVENCARSTGHSRILVTEGDIDHVVGMILVRDLLTLADERRSQVTARDLARPVLFYPDGMPIHKIVSRAEVGNHQLVVLIDEQRRTTGVLTMHNMVDHLLGIRSPTRRTRTNSPRRRISTPRA